MATTDRTSPTWLLDHLLGCELPAPTRRIVQRARSLLVSWSEERFLSEFGHLMKTGILERFNPNKNKLLWPLIMQQMQPELDKPETTPEFVNGAGIQAAYLAIAGAYEFLNSHQNN
jgi:hypothetical protein